MPGRRIKLLIVIIDLTAGTGTFTRNLAGGMRRRFGEEFEVSLLALRRGTIGEADRELFDSIDVLNTLVGTGWRRVIELPIHLCRLRRAIRRHAPDLIFTVGTYSNVLAPLAAPSVPVVLSEHMNMTLRTQAARFGGVMTRLMRRVYPHHLIVCAARGITRDLEDRFGARRTRVIPNGLDPEKIRARAGERAAPVPARGPFLIAVGRLTPQKDFATLLRGFAHARAKGLALELVIAGDGEERAMLEALVSSLGIASAVHFLGHVSNPYPIIRQAQFLVLSSLWEGFAYVPLEAMALGVPCIATDCPSGPSEILGDGTFGLLVPPANPQALGEAMIRMAQPQEQAKFAQRAAERSIELTTDRMVEQYRELFFEEIGAERAGAVQIEPAVQR